MKKHFEYFLTVEQEGNITRAAKKLYISQPALSKYIMNLEEKLGTPLFERTGTPLQLTYAGELYKQYILEEEQRDKDLRKKLEEIASNQRGKIKVGVTMYRSSYLMPAVMPVFRQRYPLVQVELVEGNSLFLNNELLADHIQFYISNTMSFLNYSQIDYETLFRENIYLAVSLSYPKLRNFLESPELIREQNSNGIFPFLDISKVSQELFFMTLQKQSLTDAVESALSSQKIHLNNVFRTSNLTTAINMASSGMGFTFIPEMPLLQPYIPDNFIYFNISEPPVFWEHSVFLKKGAYIPKTCQLFIETLKEINPCVHNN